MSVKRKYYVAPLLFAAAWISGCVSVPLAPASHDATAKQFAPDPGKSVIYVYRNAFLGGGVKMPLVIDGKLRGITVGQTYIRVIVPPGPHNLTSIARNNATLALTTEAGKIYFVHQQVKVGIPYAGTNLKLVDTQIGKDGVRQCRLVAPSPTSE